MSPGNGPRWGTNSGKSARRVEMTSGQWWGTGFGGYEKAKEERAREFGPRRFFIPKPKPGQFNTKNIVFLSDDPFGFWEHDYKLNGQWGNHDVCISMIDGPCPLDVGRNEKLPINKYFIGLFSILDLSEWKKDDGKIIKYQKQTFAAKDKIAAKIKRHKEKRGSLIGVEFAFTRDSGDQTPATGDDMEFVKEWKLPELLDACKSHFKAQDAKSEFIEKFNLDPFDFTKTIKPRTRKELLNVYEQIKNGGGGGSSGGGASNQADEDVPF